MADKCGDGTNSFMGYTVTVDWKCLESGDSGNAVTEAQALIRNATDAITVDSIVKVREFAEWESLVTTFESGNVDDGCGNLRRMRKACSSSNPPWSAVLEYTGSYAVELLRGSEGTIARYNPDGSRREAYGFCLGGIIIPPHAQEVESLGRLDWQWEGGSPGDDQANPVVPPDRGFVKFYNAAGTQEFPVPAP